MQGVDPADLTTENMVFLARDSEEKRWRIIFWHEAAELARATNLPVEAGYGWRRMNVRPLTLDNLFELGETALRRLLSSAISDNIIPDISDDLNAIFDRLEDLRFEQGLLVSQRFAIQLLNEADGEPLTDYIVERIDAESQVIAQDITDAVGQASFSVVFTGQTEDEETPPSRDIQLRIQSPENEVITEPSTIFLTVVRDETEVQQVRVSLLEPEDTTAPVETVTSPDIARLLGEREIQTIDQLRRAGGPRRIPGLDPEDSEVQRLEAHVQLSVLSKDVGLNNVLIDRGYTSLGEIAEQPRAKFVSEFVPRMTEYQAALLKRKAEAQHKVLTNIATGLRTDIINGRLSTRELTNLGLDRDLIAAPSSCSCEDCEAAVSPLAYLADLLEYAVTHVKNGDDDITLRWLERNFYQPFGDLPTDCDAVDRRVRQVRLCVEVLWRLHEDNQSDTEIATLLERTSGYRRNAYETLLRQMGTSREELRLVIGANDPEERDRLAERLNISSAILPDLFIDIEESPERLTDTWLEDVFGLVDARRDPFVEGDTPQLATWRQEYRRERWQELDWPEDTYTDTDEGLGLPIIDPDIIGPDDFRQPVSGQQPFALWEERRLAIDTRYQELRDRLNAEGTTPTLEAVFSSPLPDFTELQENLARGIDVETTQAEITNLHLTAESLNRLVELRELIDTAEEITKEDIDEFVNILVQVEKRANLYDAWRQEEIDRGIELSPQWFWVSLREPAEGAWPPMRQDDTPWIDPDLLKLKDLPEPTVGQQAIALYNSRVEELKQLYQALETERETNGFEAMLLLALGNPLPHDLDTLQADLSSPDPSTVESAREAIETDLHMTVEDFSLLILVRGKATSDDPDEEPTPSELDRVYTLLQRAHKVSQLYPQWLTVEAETTDESDRGMDVAYWRAIKARLPLWRASTEARQAWHQALAIRSQPPLIDPDRNQTAEMVFGQPSFDIMRDRLDLVKDREDRLGDIQNSAATPRDAIETMLTDSVGLEMPTLGATVDDLFALSEQQRRGESIEARLRQLNLSRRAFIYLLEILQQVEAGVELVQFQWADIRSIVLRIAKERLSTTWREEEKAAGLFMSPDYFNLSTFEPKFFKERRASRQERQDWRDRLSSRIEQLKAIINSLQETVSNAEEQTFPGLRNVLIANASFVELLGAVNRADAIQNQYLIDTRTDGCFITTRISQAIETLQSLLWQLRTAQLRDSLPDLELVDDDFDEKWKWIGSYASWRSAMFVFLYPENVLQPTLRRRQTPAFRELVDSIRMDGRLTREKACQAAKRYEEYFFDVADLQLDASCQATTSIYADEQCQKPTPDKRRLFYLFARGGVSDKAYWSAYDSEDKSGYAQSFWARVPGLENAKKILGAVPYAGYIWLFAKTRSKGIEQLFLTRFDLDLNRWDDSPQEIGLPNDMKSFRAAVAQQSAFSEPPQLFLQESSKLWHQKVEINSTTTDPEQENGEEDNEESNGWKEIKLSRQQLGYRLKPIQTAIRLRFGFCFIFKTRAANNTTLSYECWAVNKNFSSIFSIQTITPATGISKFKGVIIRDIDDENYQIFILIQFSILSDTSSFRVFNILNRGKEVSVLSKEGRIQFTGDKGYLSHHCSDDIDDLKKRRRNILLQYDVQPVNQGFLARAVALLKKQIYLSLIIIDSSDLELRERRRKPFTPKLIENVPVSEKQSEAQLLDRKQAIRNIFERNRTSTVLLTYIQEAYYYVPIYLALQLQKRGQYLASLDWFRTVYYWGASSQTQRKIYYGLVRESSAELTFQRNDDWLLDPLNPHNIAETRRNTYTRFTLISIAQCLLDYANAEFTKDTSESVPRARELYRTALDLLKEDDLKPTDNVCDELIGNITIEVGEGYQPFLLASVAQLREFSQPAQLRPVIAEINAIAELPDLDDAERVSRIATTLDSAKSARPTAPPVRTVVAQKRNKGSVPQTAIIANSAIYKAANRSAEVAEADFNHAVMLASGFSVEELQEGQDLPWLRDRKSTEEPNNNGEILTAQVFLPALDRYRGSFKQREPFVPAPSYDFCIPPNPIVDMLRQRAELNLKKIRTCRNIAGLERQIEPYAAPTDTVSGLPSALGGQILLPGASGFRPTAYRYIVLIERAKQLVQLATQAEAAMLSALEKQDAELYNLLKARQDIQLARAGVRLQDLRVREAESGVELAELQRDRAQLQVNTYEEWIETFVNSAEKELIESYKALKEAQIYAARVAMAADIARSSVTAATADYSAAATAIALTIFSAAADQSRIAREGVISTEIETEIASLNASYERRKQEWEFQKEIAQKDVAIGEQQIQLANDRVDVVEQERRIAQIQTQQAAEVLEFLNNKFTNAALYDWMSNVLEGIYGYFLQQATNTAKLAENQLAFERQEIPPAFIREDYWESPDENVGIGGISTGNTPDRRGLTGSARLLQDITRLDQYAFETDRRKLQLSTTLSLARLAPIEFQQFKETGVITFATPMEMFDRQFPGHYLRLVKRVRVSVIALIPPTQGTHATLTASPNSRVVVRSGGIFQTTVINDGTNRSVALSSPIDATGVFELNQQSEMLLPFENMGVDATWELRMPKPANLFDYSTLADVLITIEYTALNSYDYRQHVIQQLDPSISGDRPFSFRNELADQWYDLNNPDRTNTPMIVRFSTRREDFPPNIDNLKIQHIVLYFVRRDGADFEVPVTHLHFTEQNGIGTVGGGSSSIDGIISTRRGNAGSWTAMIGKSPFGEWELAFPDAPGDVLPDGRQVRNLFEEELIEDILLVITYQGNTSEWPV
jgi:hypothetical protein